MQTSENEDRLADATDDADVTELSESEDVELDVLEAYEELKAGKEEPEAKEHVEVSPEDRVQSTEEPQEVTEPKEVKAEAATTEEMKAPSSWSLEDKEWFNGQPIEAKRALNKRAQNLERLTHETLRKDAESRKQYSDIDEAVKPYEAKWNAKGISRSQALRALAEANDKLDEDPVAGTLQILASYGLTPEDLMNGSQNGQAQTHQADPKVAQLEQQLAAMQNQLSEGTRAEQAVKQQAELSEIYQVRDETDQAGRYLRPEMHDDTFAARLIPVYDSLKRSDPSKSPRELMNQAYTALSGKLVNSNRALPNNTQQNARRASLSVPGSPVASVSPHSSVPDSVEDTVRETARELGFDI